MFIKKTAKVYRTECLVSLQGVDVPYSRRASACRRCARLWPTSKRMSEVRTSLADEHAHVGGVHVFGRRARACRRCARLWPTSTRMSEVRTSLADEHAHLGGAHVVGRVDVVDVERDHFTFELFPRRRDVLAIVDFCLVLDVDPRSTNHHFRCRCANIGDGPS